MINQIITKILNKYKSKIYHIDYSNNKKRDITSLLMGLNIIRDICYKKFKNIFLNFHKKYIYRRKIVKSKTPRKRIINSENKKNKLYMNIMVKYG